ncbi:MAG: phosphate ABC transporter ATP-binding protein [Planctomycetes bacterium]|nr:phosphate ABC transporter ATP-binding protein [Planctomycetota bacterium]MBU4399242.1 phosphate ABC transporter ATP-binding protein [Planctomycetota bacterium]MCG2684708.1 phosphate ABC transporter ATP-binding protein [Planctomycetales bacterium]
MNAHVRFENVAVTYGRKTALEDVSLEIPRMRIFAVIGPANSGKTTLLKCINRTIDFIPHAKVGGRVLIAREGEKVSGTFCAKHPAGRSGKRFLTPFPPPDYEDVFRIRNVYQLRRRVGMVFPLPVGLPLSVYENVAYAPRRAGIHNRHELDEIVETCLRQAMLWDEVKDRMHMLGTMLSGGQQQRLTLARALSLRPEILCLDEFSIAIDPVTTMRIEDILRELKNQMTIVLVTNLVQQARRLADYTAFFSASRLIEVDETETIFTNAANQLTERYVTGDFG